MPTWVLCSFYVIVCKTLEREGFWYLGGPGTIPPGAQRDDCIFVAEMLAALKEREKICKTYMAYLTWDHFEGMHSLSSKRLNEVQGCDSLFMIRMCNVATLYYSI